MVIADYRVEAWTLPSQVPFEKVVADVPHVRGAFGRALSRPSENRLTLKGDFDRLTELIDPTNNTETLLRCFTGSTEVGNMILRIADGAWSDGAEEALSGPDAYAFCDDGVVLPRDWVDQFTEVKDPDWVWTDTNQLLQRPSFEGGGDEDEGTTSWERGSMEGWEVIPASGDFRASDDVEVVNDPANARTGDWCVKIDPGTRHSGIRKTFTCEPGERITFNVWLKGSVSGDRWTVGMTVKSGYTVHHTNGFTYNGIAMAELENVARNPAGDGTPGGSTDGTYQQTTVDVTTGSSQTSFTVYIQFDHHGHVNAPLAHVDDFTFTAGGTPVLQPWTGRNSSVTVETTNVRTGSQSAQVVTDGTGVDADGIEQVVTDRLTIGRTYTIGFWVQHNVGSNVTFRAVAANVEGGWQAASTTVVPTGLGSWTLVAVEFTAASESITASLRVSSASATTFYTDDALLAEGSPATTWGDILTQLITAIKARSTLTYLKTDSFTAAVTSAGNAWDTTDVAVRIARGRTLTQVLDVAKRWGIEAEVVWNGGASQYELKVYNRGEAGTDQTATTFGKITDPYSARVFRRIPGANVVLAEGDERVFAVDTDATRVAAVGRREAYEGDVAYLRSPVEVAEARNNRELARYEVRATLIDRDGQSVWDTYAVGDLWNIELPPQVPLQALRVDSMQLVIDPALDQPETTLSLVRAP